MMKPFILALATFLFCFSLNAQEKIIAKDSIALPTYETFEMTEGDTTYVMKKYFLCIYKKGENRAQEEADLNELQKQHMNHLGQMAEDGYAQIAGPFAEDGKLRGLIVISAFTKEEAVNLVAEDPMVKAGRLAFDIHPFWAAKGSKLE